jgi:toxin YoeB
MEIKLTIKAQADLSFWQKTKNDSVLNKIRQLLESIDKTPFSGIGKPESLKHNYSGIWSRRIDKKNRILYEITDNIITIYSLKGHYSDK